MFDPTQVANILGFGPMADKCRITYDNSVADTFNVHTPAGVVKSQRKNNLYTYKPGPEFLAQIAKNKSMAPPREATSNAQFEDSDTEPETDSDTESECDPANQDANLMVSTVKENTQNYSSSRPREPGLSTTYCNVPQCKPSNLSLIHI